VTIVSLLRPTLEKEEGAALLCIAKSHESGQKGPVGGKKGKNKEKITQNSKNELNNIMATRRISHLA